VDFSLSILTWELFMHDVWDVRVEGVFKVFLMPEQSEAFKSEFVSTTVRPL
jgi:hypothetical protein